MGGMGVSVQRGGPSPQPNLFRIRLPVPFALAHQRPRCICPRRQRELLIADGAGHGRQVDLKIPNTYHVAASSNTLFNFLATYLLRCRPNLLAS
jgi:hypothetical protein